MLGFMIFMVIAGAVILAFMLESGHTEFERFQRLGEGDSLFPREDLR